MHRRAFARLARSGRTASGRLRSSTGARAAHPSRARRSFPGRPRRSDLDSVAPTSSRLLWTVPFQIAARLEKAEQALTQLLLQRAGLHVRETCALAGLYLSARLFEASLEEEAIAIGQVAYEPIAELGQLLRDQILLRVRLLIVDQRFDRLVHRYLASPHLVDDQVPRDREQIVLVGVDAVVAEPRLFGERAHERLRQRVVQIERLQLEAAGEESCDRRSIKAIRLLESSTLPSPKPREQLAPVEKERHPRLPYGAGGADCYLFLTLGNCCSVWGRGGVLMVKQSILVLVSLVGCGDVGSLGESESDVAPHLAEGTPEACALLRVAREASFETLDDDAALDRRAARNIVDAREEIWIGSIATLDSIRRVGNAAINKLDRWAQR